MFFVIPLLKVNKCLLHKLLARKSISGINEHQIFARLDYECRMEGAEMLAYPPVIAGGNRATVIHYINNNQRVLNGEMVLMDAGKSRYRIMLTVTLLLVFCLQVANVTDIQVISQEHGR